MRILKPLPGTLPMPERNLIGEWPMNSLGNEIYDLSGNSLMGTITGDVSWQPGKFGMCLDFEGTDGDYISLPVNPLLDFSGNIPFSLLVWVLPDAPAANDWILRTGLDIVLRSDDGDLNNIEFIIPDFAAPDNIQSTSNPMTTGKLFHIGAVYDGKSMFLFINGVLEASAVCGAGIIAQADLGKWEISVDAVVAWNGKIDAPMIYRRALSASEISQLYRESFYRYPENRVFAVA